LNEGTSPRSIIPFEVELRAATPLEFNLSANDKKVGMYEIVDW